MLEPDWFRAVYNQRGTAEQTHQGRQVCLSLTRLSISEFLYNDLAGLQQCDLCRGHYNSLAHLLGALHSELRHADCRWSSLQLIYQIGPRRLHARAITFQLPRCGHSPMVQAILARSTAWSVSATAFMRYRRSAILPPTLETPVDSLLSSAEKPSAARQKMRVRGPIRPGSKAASCATQDPPTQEEKRLFKAKIRRSWRQDRRATWGCSLDRW